MRVLLPGLIIKRHEAADNIVAVAAERRGKGKVVRVDLTLQRGEK